MSLSIVLYVYLMSLYFQFCVLHFFVENLKIEYDPDFGGRRNFLENWRVVSLDTLGIENFDEIALSHTVKKIQAVCVLLIEKIVNVFAKFQVNR